MPEEGVAPAAPAAIATAWVPAAATAITLERFDDMKEGVAVLCVAMIVCHSGPVFAAERLIVCWRRAAYD